MKYLTKYKNGNKGQCRIQRQCTLPKSRTGDSLNIKLFFVQYPSQK